MSRPSLRVRALIVVLYIFQPTMGACGACMSPQPTPVHATLRAACHSGRQAAETPLGERLRLRGGFQAVTLRQPDANTDSLCELFRSCLDVPASIAFSRTSMYISGWGSAAAVSLIVAQVVQLLVTALLQHAFQFVSMTQPAHTLHGSSEGLANEVPAGLGPGNGARVDGEHSDGMLPHGETVISTAQSPNILRDESSWNGQQHQADYGAPPELALQVTPRSGESLGAHVSQLEIPADHNEHPQAAASNGKVGHVSLDRLRQHLDEQPQVPGIDHSEVEEIASHMLSAEPGDTVDPDQSVSGIEVVKSSRQNNPVLEQVFGDERQHDRMQEVETPPGLTTELMTHQKMGLGWMKRREEDGHLASIWWEQVAGGLYGYEAPTWVNLLTGQDRSMDKPPLEARGGILADDMGLGKTLTILALIVSDFTAQLAVQHIARTNEAGHAQRLQDNECAREEVETSRPTLIVCPLSVLHNWQMQITAHTNSALRVLVYHGPTRTRDLEELMSQHIVLTTYSVLQSDMRGSRGREGAGTRASVLHSVQWRRVVLDEAHVIANPKAKQSKAVMMLQAERRWAVTGTPLQNKMDDLMTLFAFVRIEPLDDPEWFRRLVGDPSRSKCPRRQAEALQVVRSVLAQYCLRRTKDQRIRGAPILQLPPKTEIVRTLEFSEPERALYDQLFQSGKAMFRTYMREGSVMTHYTKILERLLRLRQLCNHPSLLPTAANDSSSLCAAAEPCEVEQDGGMDVRRLVEMLESRLAGGEEECCVCLDDIDPSAAVITKCAHIFCSPCLQRCLHMAQGAEGADEGRAGDGRCPLCRTELSAYDVVAAPLPASTLALAPAGDPSDPTSPRRLVSVSPRRQLAPRPSLSPESDEQPIVLAAGNEQDGAGASCGPGWSTKLQAILDELDFVNREHPGEKVVIFSQFTSFLDIMQSALAQREVELGGHGGKVARLDGTMPRAKRNLAMSSFSHDPDTDVLLVSIKAGGTGLNLVSANHVFITDLWWNSAVEAQAMDRVHRYGQEKPVRVVRFVTAGTIEERIVELQNKKRTIIAGAMGGASKGSLQESRTSDLRMLFT